MSENSTVERQTMEADIVCVGFGPATGGFLTRLSRGMTGEDGGSIPESQIMPGMPPVVICYERADDLPYGVSGVSTRAKALRESFPDLNPQDIPMATAITSEKMVYLLDPAHTSRKSWLLKLADFGLRATKFVNPWYKKFAFQLPYTPPFLNKHGGYIFGIGQFNQWVANQLMMTGLIQLWPGTPVEKPLVHDKQVDGVQLVDQGVTRDGDPDTGYMPGMEVHARLTVCGDGPVGPVGRQLDEHFGVPKNHSKEDWAVGAKFVIQLPDDTILEPGTVIHTFGYPEPEIFGFFYVHPDQVASAGIFVPSWMKMPHRTAYRYLQHWLQHPYLWQFVEGGTLRSYGAKSLMESGLNAEPFLTGNGYARIGEGSGSTNVLTNSGVDEAWKSGTLLAEATLKLLRENLPFSQENLQATYEKMRRESWLHRDLTKARHARDGFNWGLVPGIISTALAGMTGGKLFVPAPSKPARQHTMSPEKWYQVSAQEVAELRQQCQHNESALRDELMEKRGWPKIQYDGKLLISHQDALLVGGKVQAPAGYRDHIVFTDHTACIQCLEKACVDICSGQAITRAPDGGLPQFDREKCLHCGACTWVCQDRDKNYIQLLASPGGLHSVEN